MKVAVVLTLLLVSSSVAAVGTAAASTTDSASTTVTSPASTRAVADVTASTTPAGAATDSNALVERTVTYHRTPDRAKSIEVEVAFDVNASVDRLCVILYSDYETMTTDGFEHQPDMAGCLYEWRRPTGLDEDASPSVSFRLDTQEYEKGGYEAVERGDWALLMPEVRTWFYSPATGGDLRFVDDPTNPRTVSTYRVAGDGVAVDGLAYFGESTIDEWTANGEQVRLVQPVAVSRDLPTAAIRETVGRAAADLSIGGRDGPVTLVAAPDPLRRGGVSSGPNAAWVHHESATDNANNVWVHEYVHTRQRWILRQEVDWFTEASAEYYAALASYRQGSISYATFHDHVATDADRRVVLASPESQGFDGGEYTKGARVAAALDRQIRLETDGNRSLEDVVYLMNRHDGPVSYDDFVGMVERVAGTSMRSWLDRFVRSSAVPNVPTSDSWLVETPENRDADSDGVNETVEKDIGTDPFDEDSDDDGLRDGMEVGNGSDPLLSDSDGDGFDDGRELALGTDPGAVDSDGDGLGDVEEVDELGTDPTTTDTDGDGLSDGREAELVDVDPTTADTDDDGLDDATEVASELFDPSSPDLDGDGLLDGREHELETNPMRSDSDGDGLADDVEVNASMDPLSNDTDGDGLADAVEFVGETNATNADSDGDGIEDGEDDAPLVAPTTTSASTTSAGNGAPGATPGFTFVASGIALLVGLGARTRWAR